MLHYAGDMFNCAPFRNQRSVDLAIRAQKGGPTASPNPFDPCATANIMGNFSTQAEVQWNVDMDEWDTKALYQVGIDIPPPASSEISCQVITPDLSDVVREVLEDGWEPGNALTFFIRDATKALEKCDRQPGQVFLDPFEFMGRVEQPPMTFCNIGERMESAIRESYPLWIIPSEDRARKDSS